MRDLRFCRNCKHFAEYGKGSQCVRTCLLNIGKIIAETKTPLATNKYPDITDQVCFSDSEYESLKLDENCLYYTEQFISECCRNGRK